MKRYRFIIIGILLMMVYACNEEQKNFVPKLQDVGDLVLAEAHITKYYKIGSTEWLDRFEVWKSAPYTYTASVDFSKIKVLSDNNKSNINNDSRNIITFVLPPVKISGAYKKWGDGSCVYESVNLLRSSIDDNERLLEENKTVAEMKAKFSNDSLVRNQLINQATASARIYLTSFMENFYGEDITVYVEFNEDIIKYEKNIN